MHTPPLIVILYATAGVASLMAAVTDTRTARIPNWLTFSLALFGVGLNLVVGGKGSAVISLLGFLAAAIVPAILYRVSHGRAIGGGDVKLFAGLGALLGPVLSIEVEFGAFVLLAAFALIRLTFRGALWRVLLNSACLLVNPFLPPKCRRAIEPQALTQMRLGPAIACSVASTLVLEHLRSVVPWLS